MEELWNSNGMPGKRATGEFDEIVVYERPAMDPSYRGGASVIIKLLTRTGGQHVGTMHEIRMPDGTRPHSHPKDYTLRDCSRVSVNWPEPKQRSE